MKRRPSNFTAEEVRAEEGSCHPDQDYEIINNLEAAFPTMPTTITSHRRTDRPNKHGFRGVYKDKRPNRRKRWMAQIRVMGRGQKKSLGVYHTKEEAARAYDKAAKIIYGKFAVLNFPESESRDQGV